METDVIKEHTQKIRERGGLIPITARILTTGLLTPEENVEYKGIVLSDVYVVGHIIDYNESDTKVKLRLWDGSGIIDVVFFNKNEAEHHPGLTNFYYTG